MKSTDHEWLKDWNFDWPGRALTAIRYDDQWTIADRDTGVLVGSFGMLSLHDTEEEAIAEAERFGSKWGWPTIPGGLVGTED